MTVKTERKEGWMRIVVGIVTGIILCVWRVLVVVLAIINWLIVIFSGKRNKGLAEMTDRRVRAVQVVTPFQFPILDRSHVSILLK